MSARSDATAEVAPRLSTDIDVRRAHSADVSGLVMVPDSVARPTTGEEVRDIVLRAAAAQTPMTAAGSQTSTTGASITEKGILLSMRAMDRIIDVDVWRRRAIVEPGVLLGDLNRALAAHGLMFPPDPTSLDDVTVGGAIACNASGARSLRYGATRPHVHGLSVVLASGEEIEVRRSGLEKNTVGYAFAQEPVDWFVGSEGTLGIITRAELSLVAVPARVLGLALPFEDDARALAAVVALRSRGLVRPNVDIRCIEYFDRAAVAIARQHAGAPWKDAPLLYIEDVSDSADVEAWLAMADSLGARIDDIGVFEGETALREARKYRHAVPATMNERGSARRSSGGRKVSTDWAVPYPLLAEAIDEARRLAAEARVFEPVIYGHAGNGHPHQNFIAHDAAELHRIEAVVEATLRFILSLGGTVSAEHGIGKLKRRWVGLQASAVQMGVMRAMKRELDPQGILAPGNIL